MIIVSACLMGENCRYDGNNCFNRQLNKILKGREIQTICPETAGKLPVPREPAEIIAGDGFDVLDGKARVLSRTGQDITPQFVEGSGRTLENCRNKGEDHIKLAILKARSPSCGVRAIYNGHFKGKLRPGPGVMAARLQKEKIPVFTEEDIDKIKKILEG